MARDLTGRQFCLIMFLAFSLVVVAAGDATAETTWYVDDDAPADFSTIQAALNAASDGDTIIVRDGTYTGAGNRDIDFNGKAVHLRSENGPDNCIINCQGTWAERHRGFYFHNGEDENSIVDGFTITNGNAGAGIYCYRYSSPTITNNTIAGNTGDYYGVGIYCYRYSSPTITNNTITANTADDGGGGISCSSDSSPTITNCILWGNGDDLDNCSAMYSCIQDGDAGQGNISSYPYFADPASGDYHLLSWSPCIDAGDPGFAPQPGETDIDGNPRIIGGRVDMGAYEAATKSPDADGDGLPDDWEIDNFGNLSYGPDDDPDGDALTNLQEYELGTDPNTNVRTIYVSASNAGDPLADGTIDHPFQTIQQGVDTSTENVLVAEGTYSEQLAIDGKTLHILGGYDVTFAERDPASHVTVIDAAGGGSVVRYIDSPTGTLDGFTITGGAASYGGGISCRASSPTITNNTITSNTAAGDYYQGGLGGGIFCWDSSPTITSNTITANMASGYGGGIYSSSSSPTITNNTIADNTAIWNGGGIYCAYRSSPTITNCILWENGDDLYGCSATYSSIQDGDAGQGNISYPYFVDPDNGDYHLLSWSLCIDAGDPGFAPQPGETDVDGNPRIIGGRVDMGACEAAVKSPDTDSDGLPDGWEIDNFGNLSYGSDDDPDGDGLTNLEEYELGTNPKVDPRTIHVSAANVDDPLADGSVDHPFPTIQQGIDASTESVLVAEGTHVEHILIYGKTLHILGGYNATFAERDPASHITVIDPAGGGSVVRYRHSHAGTLDGFTITGGAALSGGGIHCDSSSPTITSNIITANRAWYGGGGIYCYNSSPTITNNIITDNMAWSGRGGGLFCTDNSSPTITNNTITANTALRGGGIYCDNSSPPITNNTITANTAAGDHYEGGSGGGIYCYKNSSPTITNSILWGNSAPTGPEIYLMYQSNRPSTLTVRYSDVAGGVGAAYVEEGSTLDLDSTNIDAVPLFADPDNGNYHLKSQYGRWDPAANAGAGGWVTDAVSSPCIDAGDPEADYANEPMPNFGRVNMGAYGNTPQASKSGWNIPGDINGDCVVNVLDLLNVRNRLGDDPASDDNWKADLDGDGVINVLDLMTVRNELGATCQ